MAVLYEARNHLNFQTVFVNVYRALLYGSIVSRFNVHLQIHDGIDFVTQLQQYWSKQKTYKDDGQVILYFNFPILGVTVPLWLGNLLLFDATKPHAISAWYNKKLDVYCVSFYLKSAFVELKNNSASLTPFEELFIERHNL